MPSEKLTGLGRLEERIKGYVDRQSGLTKWTYVGLALESIGGLIILMEAVKYFMNRDKAL